MIHLLNETLEPIGSFASYDDLVDYIHKAELSKLNFLNRMNHILERPYAFEQQLKWRFVTYKHAELVIIYSAMKEPPLTGIEKEAFRQELDLIEVHSGDAGKPLQISVTADLDIRQLRKEWCESYCAAQGYTLEDTGKDGLLENGGADDPVV